MKDRILHGWNIRRIIFVLIGIYVIYQSVIDKTWWGIALGIYFASMGLFSFGCAGGNCYGNNCSVNPSDRKDSNSEEHKQL